MRAVQSKDARFDGWFFTAVLTTGIYCRPSCPVVPPKVGEHDVLPQRRRRAAGRVPGVQAVPARRQPRLARSGTSAPTLVARAMRLIADGVVDRDGVPGLAARLGYSTRQVERQLRAELGAGPLALARAQRAQTARLLIETTAAADERRRRSPPGSPASGRSTTPCARCSRLTPTGAADQARRGGRRAGDAGSAGAAAAVPRAAVPGQPVRAPRRDRRTRASRSGATARTAARCGCRTGTGSSRCARTRPHRLPADPHRPARPVHRDQPLPAAAGPRRRPGRRRRPAGPATRCWPRTSTSARAAGCPARSTARSSRYGPCSASRSPPRRPARTPPGW